ncbi:hypothetical protein [Serratia marcescens]|uniref:hypothetical protein n=1 Tax=Serratia marcescens TaxID=615 RepID=UPI00217BEE21|nr:hypothetical protein [Serratia marcescens]CAI1948985.1 Uncharacterised protein [Serratia marcescens]
MKFLDLPDCAQKEACELLSSKYYNTKDDINKMAKDIAHAFCTLFAYELNADAEEKIKQDKKTKKGLSDHQGYIYFGTPAAKGSERCDCWFCIARRETAFAFELDQSVIAKNGMGYGRVVSRSKEGNSRTYAVNIESGAMKGKTLYFKESDLYGVP